MEKAATSLAVLLFTIGAFLGVARAGDVQYNPRSMVEKELVDQAFDRAEVCLRGILLVDLGRGERNHDRLVDRAVARCEQDLAAYLQRLNPKYADADLIHASLLAAANRQLEFILATGH